ncbi:hypothetical protein H2198_005189 [Neophaeococcomyces mojaviensis]|uniref:Uncharacterized protein n=1 Tax=Neophaeococcomyces mojaviensis TaxID=3383035 RepID=A0ACC3A6Y4_9EURO|nr:hypothetical protein H2198_005189 [Knufia sp. JES_112]
MPVLQYYSGAHSDEHNIPTTQTISPPTPNMEQDLHEETSEAHRVRVWTVPYLTMSQLLQLAMQTGEWFVEPEETPVERIMRVVQLIMHYQEQYWTESEVVYAFLQNVQQALTDDSATNVIVQQLWNSNYAPSAAALASTFSIVLSRLQLACQALDADDPQLAMSIIMWRTIKSFEYYEYSREEIPLADPLASQVAAQSNDRLLLIDSAYCKYRFPVVIADLGKLVEDMVYTSRSGRDGFLQSIPKGVLQGLSNHEVREQQFRKYEADLHIWIGDMSVASIPVHEQQHHLRDLEISWAMRAEDPEHISWRLPPPLPLDSTMFFCQLDAIKIVELISNEIRWLCAVVDAQETSSANTDHGGRDWIDSELDEEDIEQTAESEDYRENRTVPTLRRTDTTYLGEHEVMEIDSSPTTSEHSGSVVDRPLDPLTEEVVNFIAENYEPEVWGAMLRRVNSSPARILQSTAATRSEIKIESQSHTEPTDLDPDDAFIWEGESQSFIYFRNPHQAATVPLFNSSTSQLPFLGGDSPCFDLTTNDESVDPTAPALPSRPPTSYPIYPLYPPGT